MRGSTAKRLHSVSSLVQGGVRPWGVCRSRAQAPGRPFGAPCRGRSAASRRTARGRLCMLRDSKRERESQTGDLTHATPRANGLVSAVFTGTKAKPLPSAGRAGAWPPPWVPGRGGGPLRRVLRAGAAWGLLVGGRRHAPAAGGPSARWAAGARAASAWLFPQTQEAAQISRGQTGSPLRLNTNSQ